MTQLAELSRLIRSKNAGPFTLTFDIMFNDDETYQRVKRAPTLTKEIVAGLYGMAPQDTLFFHCDNACAVKISIPRPYTQGDLLDPDSHGGQQYAPLMSIEIP
jgi:hypothetical protein